MTHNVCCRAYGADIFLLLFKCSWISWFNYWSKSVTVWIKCKLLMCLTSNSSYMKPQKWSVGFYLWFHFLIFKGSMSVLCRRETSYLWLRWSLPFATPRKLYTQQYRKTLKHRERLWHLGTANEHPESTGGKNKASQNGIISNQELLHSKGNKSEQTVCGREKCLWILHLTRDAQVEFVKNFKILTKNILQKWVGISQKIYKWPTSV